MYEDDIYKIKKNLDFLSEKLQIDKRKLLKRIIRSAKKKVSYKVD